MTEADRLRALVAEWARGDFSGVVPLLAEDVRVSGAQPEGQVEVRGPDAVVRFMAGFLQQWELYTVAIEDFEDLGGGRYLATGTQHGKGKGSALDVTAPVNVAIRTSAGAIAELHFFLDRSEAVAALNG